MNYSMANKEAWNEAQMVQEKGRKEDIVSEILKGNYQIDKVIYENVEIKDKVIGQICCNNGRELLSLMKMGAKESVGFDISDNFIKEAKNMAEKLNYNSKFICTDILEIEGYDDIFDILLITVGTFSWFQDLDKLFKKVSKILKKNGQLVIHEFHPITNLFAVPGEDEYEERNPKKFTYSYFRKELMIETNGIDYVGGTQYKSKPFYSFMHTFSEIINSIVNNNIKITKINEFDYDIGLGIDYLNKQGIPLSYILIGKKIDNN